MNKYTLLLSFSALLLTSISCNKKDNSGDTVAVPDYKDTISSWAVDPSSAYNIRLDLNGANLNGTPFTLVLKCSDNSEVHCANTVMSGSEGAGTFVSGACVDATGGPMSTAFTTTLANFGSGTYTNSGTRLSICQSVGVCRDYNP
jgi:hypothetical protein